MVHKLSAHLKQPFVSNTKGNRSSTVLGGNRRRRREELERRGVHFLLCCRVRIEQRFEGH
jgi:hypothetical protein